MPIICESPLFAIPDAGDGRHFQFIILQTKQKIILHAYVVLMIVEYYYIAMCKWYTGEIDLLG